MSGAQTISIWKRLYRKRSARASLWLICLCCLAAILAYPLAPDSTPDANRIIPELGAKSPGFSKQFLLIPAKQALPDRGWLRGLFTGRPAKYSLKPLNSYVLARDSVVIYHYIDEGLQDIEMFRIADLLPQSDRKLPVSEQQQLFDRKLIVRKTFWLGTDRYGRDILSRLIIGTRVSISVGIVAVVLSLSIGIFLGMIAGYYRGWVDNVVMYVINMLWAIPTLLLVFAITLTLGKGFWQIFIAIGLTMWVSAARLIRGQVLVLRELDYVKAAKTLGLSDFRIMFRHILPNIAGPLMVIAASNFAAAILIEAGLSFLGIGVQPPTPSWGLMIKEHYNFLVTNRPVLAIIPGLAIMLLVYAFNILGNALRDVLDVREA